MDDYITAADTEQTQSNISSIPEDQRDNQKDSTANQCDSKLEPPIDKRNLVYLIVLVQGLSVLMPWNLFITANDYFVEYKLVTNGSESTSYQKDFISYLGISATVPQVVISGANIFCQCGTLGKDTLKITVSIMTILIIFIVTTLLAMVDSSEWPGIFFAVTMGTVVILNSAAAVYQSSIFGMAATLPNRYINAVVVGLNTGGILTSVASLTSLIIAPSPRVAGIAYFIFACFVLTVALDTYVALPCLEFYNYWQRKAQEKGDVSSVVVSPSIMKVFRKVWYHLLRVWYLHVVSLCCFPALQINISRVDPHFPIPEKYFNVIACFLVFNTMATAGNLLAGKVQKPGPRWLWIPVLLHTVFIPFFLFCNYRPETHALPVLINNDYIYIAGGMLFGFSHGYLSSLSIMYPPRCAEPEFASTIAMMSIFFLQVGIIVGVNLALLLAYLIEV